MDKVVRMGIKWRLPDSEEEIISVYKLIVPKGITPSYYLWVATGGRLPYKTQCFINRLWRKKEFLFIKN